MDVLFGIKKGLFSHCGFNDFFSNFIIYSLPDGLWYLSLLYANDLINQTFQSSVDKGLRIINLLVIVTPFVLEFGQCVGWISGTFDIWDIFIYVLVLITYLLWLKKYIEIY